MPTATETIGAATGTIPSDVSPPPLEPVPKKAKAKTRKAKVKTRTKTTGTKAKVKAKTGTRKKAPQAAGEGIDILSVNASRRTLPPPPLGGQTVVTAVNLVKLTADSTRARILLALRELGPQSVNSLCGKIGGMHSQPAVSHHLAMLRHARVVQPNRDGKFNFYELTIVGVVLADMIKRLMGEI